MSDFYVDHLQPDSTPPCPLCGGETIPAQTHAAVARQTDVFRCTRCHVEYPVARKTDGR